MRHLPRLMILVTVLSMLAPVGASAQQAIDPEGKYELVQPPQPTETPGKVEVVDVFSYACPHCFRFLAPMETFEARKPDYIATRRMPAIFRDSWETYARAYYTALLLNKLDVIHRDLFEAIHEKKQRLDTPSELRAFFVARGVSGEAFDKTFDSFAVETMLRKSKVMQGRYGIRGTPTLIVNGKYRISASAAGGFEEMIAVAEALAARDHKAMMAAN